MSKKEIIICMGSSCFVRGNKDHVNTIKKFIAEHRIEDLVSLRGEHCQNNCSKGPNIVIDGKSWNAVDRATLIDLLNNLLKELT